MSGPVPSGVRSWHRLVAGTGPLPDEHPWPASSDTALIQYTGGTTGTPKGAVLSHRNLMANVAQARVWLGSRDGAEVMYAVLPFFHAFGLTVCLAYGTSIASTLDCGAVDASTSGDADFPRSAIDSRVAHRSRAGAGSSSVALACARSPKTAARPARSAMLFFMPTHAATRVPRGPHA